MVRLVYWRGNAGYVDHLLPTDAPSQHYPKPRDNHRPFSDFW